MRGTGFRVVRTVLPACALLLAGVAFAQEADDEPLPEDLELTITLMPEGAERPEAITRVIEPPKAEAARGAEASAGGRARAEAAREGEGLDRAAEARDKGRESGEEMAEHARENREDAGRGRRPETPPGGPPDDPPGPPGDAS